MDQVQWSSNKTSTERMCQHLESKKKTHYCYIYKTANELRKTWASVFFSLYLFVFIIVVIDVVWSMFVCVPSFWASDNVFIAIDAYRKPLSTFYLNRGVVLFLFLGLKHTISIFINLYVLRIDRLVFANRFIHKDSNETKEKKGEQNLPTNGTHSPWILFFRVCCSVVFAKYVSIWFFAVCFSSFFSLFYFGLAFVLLLSQCWSLNLFFFLCVQFWVYIFCVFIFSQFYGFKREKKTESLISMFLFFFLLFVYLSQNFMHWINQTILFLCWCFLLSCFLICWKMNTTFLYKGNFKWAHWSWSFPDLVAFHQFFLFYLLWTFFCGHNVITLSYSVCEKDCLFRQLHH